MFLVLVFWFCSFVLLGGLQSFHIKSCRVKPVKPLLRVLSSVIVSGCVYLVGLHGTHLMSAATIGVSQNSSLFRLLLHRQLIEVVSSLVHRRWACYVAHIHVLDNTAMIE